LPVNLTNNNLKVIVNTAFLIYFFVMLSKYGLYPGRNNNGYSNQFVMKNTW